MPVGICTFGTYCLLLLSLTKEIFLFKVRLIDNLVGFSTIPAAGDRTLTHTLYVSLVSSQMETVSKTCPFKIGQYCLALLNSPQEEAYEHLLEAFYSLRPKEKPRESISPLSSGLEYQDLYLHFLGDSRIYISRKLMMSSMS